MALSRVTSRGSPMLTKLRALTAICIGTVVLAACAGDQGSLFGGETASVAPPPAPKVDPACVALTSKIEGLRKEGVAERVEKAAAGKGTTVNVKRDSLAKMTELDKANAEFQAKCSTITPKQQTAAVPASVAATAAPAAKAAATKAVAGAAKAAQ